VQYVQAAEKHAVEIFGEGAPDFTPALHAARRFMYAGRAIGTQAFGTSNVRELNAVLLAAERDLLLPDGLPKRPWFKHAIFAPADLKGYTAAVIPGVNEAIENGDLAVTSAQILELSKALNRAAARLESFRPSVMNAKR